MTAGILPAALFIPSRLDVGIEPYGFAGIPSLLPNESLCDSFHGAGLRYARIHERSSFHERLCRSFHDGEAVKKETERQ